MYSNDAALINGMIVMCMLQALSGRVKVSLVDMVRCPRSRVRGYEFLASLSRVRSRKSFYGVRRMTASFRSMPEASLRHH
jgi:hypothetical protein